LIPATLIGVTAMWLNTAPEPFALTLPRVGVMAICYLIYFITLIGLSLIVSAKAPSARLALVALLAFWFINSLVAPRVMADLAHHAVRTPGAAEFLQQIDEEKKRIPPDWKRKLIAGLLDKHQVTRKEDLPISLSGVLLIEQDKIDDAIYERSFSRLFDLYERQNAVYAAGGIFAPLLSMQTLSMGLAGTDFNQHRHFTEAVSQYRQQWLRVLNEDILFHQRPGQVVYTRGRDLWEQAPPLVYRPPSLQWVVANLWLNLALLIGWFLVVATLTPWALTRVSIE
jgi:ABC-2 type transport system permease protein